MHAGAQDVFKPSSFLPPEPEFSMSYAAPTTLAARFDSEPAEAAIAIAVTDSQSEVSRAQPGGAKLAR